MGGNKFALINAYHRKRQISFCFTSWSYFSFWGIHWNDKRWKLSQYFLSIHVYSALEFNYSSYILKFRTLLNLLYYAFYHVILPSKYGSKMNGELQLFLVFFISYHLFRRFQRFIIINLVGWRINTWYNNLIFVHNSKWNSLHLLKYAEIKPRNLYHILSDPPTFLSFSRSSSSLICRIKVFSMSMIRLKVSGLIGKKD